MVGARIGVAVETDGNECRLVDMSVERPIRIERPYEVVEFDASGRCLFPSPLTHHARCNTVDFEFQTVRVPLVPGLEEEPHVITGVEDVPQTHDWLVCLDRRR